MRIILENIHFTYAGISSEDMGLINVNVGDSDFFKEALIPSRNLNEIKIRGNERPYFQDLTYNPLEFNLKFQFKEGIDSNRLRYISRWLNQDYYKPLIFSSRPDRIFFCICVNDTILNHDGINGFITLTFRSNSPFSYTNMYTSPIYTSNDIEYTSFDFDNVGDTDVFPILFIDKKSIGDIEIFNQTTNQLFTMTDLADGESIEINCEREMIKTNLPFTYRYSNLKNDEFLHFSPGLNKLQIKGNFKLYFRNCFKILA